MGGVSSVMGEKNVWFYAIVLFVVFSMLATPEKPTYVSKEQQEDMAPSKRRMKHRREYLERDMQLIREELALIDEELQEKVLPPVLTMDSIRELIRQELRPARASKHPGTSTD